MLFLPSLFQELSGVVVLQGFWRGGLFRRQEGRNKCAPHCCVCLVCPGSGWGSCLMLWHQPCAGPPISTGQQGRAGPCTGGTVCATSFVELDPMEEIWKMLCCTFSLAVIREQWLGWCCIVRLIIRKINAERKGILVKPEIWSQGSQLCPWSCQYRSTNYEPKLWKKWGFLAALKCWVWISDKTQEGSSAPCNPRDLLCSLAALTLTRCAMEVNPPQRDVELELHCFIWIWDIYSSVFITSPKVPIWPNTSQQICCHWGSCTAFSWWQLIWTRPQTTQAVFCNGVCFPFCVLVLSAGKFHGKGCKREAFGEGGVCKSCRFVFWILRN